MATSIDFKALYAEARRAAAAAKQQQGAVSHVQEPSNEIANRSLPTSNDHDTGHVVEEIEDECVHLTPSGELAVDALAPFRVGDVPAVYYLPNFISDAEEQRLLSAVRHPPSLPLHILLNLTCPSQDLQRTRGSVDKPQASAPADVGYGSGLHRAYCSVSRWCAVRAGGKPSAAGMAQEELPSWLGELSQLLKEKKVFKKDFNHVLINEYEPGQGIMVRPLSSHVLHGGACSLTRDH